jgi:hypothetical protein
MYLRKPLGKRSCGIVAGKSTHFVEVDSVKGARSETADPLPGEESKTDIQDLLEALIIRLEVLPAKVLPDVQIA